MGARSKNWVAPRGTQEAFLQGKRERPRELPAPLASLEPQQPASSKVPSIRRCSGEEGRRGTGGGKSSGQSPGSLSPQQIWASAASRRQAPPLQPDPRGRGVARAEGRVPPPRGRVAASPWAWPGSGWGDVSERRRGLERARGVARARGRGRGRAGAWRVAVGGGACRRRVAG